MRIGILASHPVQYQAPWFRGLAKAAEVRVFFAHRQSAQQQASAGFGVAFDWDVDLLSGYAHQFLENKSTRPGVDHFFGCNTPAIRRIIRGGGFDGFIISGWHLKSYWQAVRACRSAGVPVLVRGDSQLLTPRSALKRLVKAVGYRFMLRQFDGFLAVGKRSREYLAHYGVPEDRLFFAPHFVDNAWFAARAKAESDQRAVMRSVWGADDQTLVVLFAGKFQPLKRIADIFNAFPRLQARNVRAVAILVGAGELDGALREEARRLGIPARFEGFKNQSELPRCYGAADVLVLPSESETWGLVVNEAMACGLPAIVSDAVGCAPDLIDEGETGFIFRVGDVDQLAGRLAQLWEMRQRGHDFAPALVEKMRIYSVETAVNGTLKAVETLRTRIHG